MMLFQKENEEYIRKNRHRFKNFKSQKTSISRKRFKRMRPCRECGQMTTSANRLCRSHSVAAKTRERLLKQYDLWKYVAKA